MKKEQVLVVIKWSTLALTIPILGEIFIKGWNWGFGDYLFAWLYFILLGTTFSFVKNNIKHREYRIISCLLVIVIFIFVWALLATG